MMVKRFDRLAYIVLFMLVIASSSYGFDAAKYVTFTPPSSGTEGSPLKFELIYSGPLKLDFILYYGVKAGKYKVSNFVKSELGKYTTTIPGYEVKQPGIYYYIEAIDEDANSYPIAGSFHSPMFVKVKPPSLEELLPESTTSFSPLDEELMLLQAENVVYTASAFAQSVLESPASIVSITSDYIDLLGGVNIGSILMWLPGIDVINFTPSDIQIGVRGFNREITNKLLTMVDGRSIYFDFFGFTSYSAQPISIFDIERIEVVKGPVSAIYGANAWSGVINIITKDPRKKQGIEIHLGDGWVDAGECEDLKAGINCFRSSYGNYQYSTYKDKQYLRVSMGWDNRSDYEHPERLSTPRLFAEDPESVKDEIGKGAEKIYANSMWGYGFSNDLNLKVQGGFSLMKGNILTELSQYGTEGNLGFITTDLTYKMFKATFFWNHLDSLSATYFKPDVSQLPSYTGTPLDVDPLIMDQNIVNDVYDFTVNQRVMVGNHKIQFGAGYRFNQVKAPHFFNDRVHRQNLFNGFFLDELKLGQRKQWIVNVAGRFDHHPITGDHLSPRVAVVYRIGDEQSVRLSASRAFRNPTFIESYLDFQLPAVVAVAPGGEILEPPRFVVAPVKAKITGNPDLKAEVIDGLDFTYQWLREGVVHITLDGFYNLFSDLIRYQSTPEGKSFTNLGKGFEFGGELSLKWFITSYLEIWTNYSYQYVHNDFDDPETYQDERGRDPRFPEHKFNVVLFGRFDKFKSALEFHYESKKGMYYDDDFIPYKLPAVDPTVAGSTPVVGYVVVSPDTYYEIPGYYLVNLNLEYVAGKNTTFGLYVYNLFNYVHREFPRPEAQQIGRIVYGKIKLEF